MDLTQPQIYTDMVKENETQRNFTNVDDSLCFAMIVHDIVGWLIGIVELLFF